MNQKQDYNVVKFDFETEKAKLSEFLTNFNDRSILTEDKEHGKKKYLIELQKIANQQQKVLEVHVEDLEKYFQNDAHFFSQIKTNTKRYVSFFYEVADKVMPRRTVKNSEDDIEPIEEVIQSQRMANLHANHGNGNERTATKETVPAELLRK